MRNGAAAIPYGTVPWSTVAKGPAKNVGSDKAQDDTHTKMRRMNACSFLSNCSTLTPTDSATNSSQWEGSSVSSASSVSMEERDSTFDGSQSPVKTGRACPTLDRASMSCDSNSHLDAAKFAERRVGMKSVLQRQLHPVVRTALSSPPTEYDLRSTGGLLQCFNMLAKFCTSEDLGMRHLAVEELQQLVDAWAAEAYPNESACRISLLLGGSWHLKIGFSDSDMDIVAFAPNFVTLDRFISSFYDFLKRREDSKLTNLVAMKKATVPILTFEISSVRIDLSFARSSQKIVPKIVPILSDEILIGMDPVSVRSLSIPRISSLILELVPHGNVFRGFVRIVRLWARRRGIYSNKAGFLGGISWNILATFICQMFPKATISVLLHHFFNVFSTWTWPTPVWVSKPYAISGAQSGCLQWSPQSNHHDRAHVMPIITPGFPSVNSAVNVTQATLRVMVDEFQRGKRYMDDLTQRQLSSPMHWQGLFQPSEFLYRYDHYIIVKVEALGVEELQEWSNYVSSRLRKLVEALEVCAPIEIVHPCPDWFEERYESDTCTSYSGYYMLGYAVHNYRHGMQWQQFALEEEAAKSIESAIRYFEATETQNCCEKKAGMNVHIFRSQWQHLPVCLIPNGDRTLAAGERARFILTNVHSKNVRWGRR